MGRVEILAAAEAAANADPSAAACGALPKPQTPIWRREDTSVEAANTAANPPPATLRWAPLGAQAPSGASWALLATAAADGIRPLQYPVAVAEPHEVEHSQDCQKQDQSRRCLTDRAGVGFARVVDRPDEGHQDSVGDVTPDQCDSRGELREEVPPDVLHPAPKPCRLLRGW